MNRCNHLPLPPWHANGRSTPGPCISNHSSTIRSRQLGLLPDNSCSSSQSSSIKTPTAKIRWQDYADGLKQMKRKSSVLINLRKDLGIVLSVNSLFLPDETGSQNCMSNQNIKSSPTTIEAQVALGSDLSYFITSNKNI